VSENTRAEREREVVDVAWRRFGLHVFLTYAEGDIEHITGDIIFALDMADDAGLTIVESSAASAHWVKNPEAWQVATWSAHA